ncbi:Hypothetical protein PMT_2799 [Prochlorococcus marinus str. MIT 9313]|uniref:Uncharacterized protein n=1 Tax=Prochlorococcus marinus (strain MIT 9313) TaxID=74547 RepID=B9ESH2_PROMM|nr:Hypothetical protein PMT_2799 [Prochlorococcus marinus str. MIT 9313]
MLGTLLFYQRSHLKGHDHKIESNRHPRGHDENRQIIRSISLQKTSKGKGGKSR